MRRNVKNRKIIVIVPAFNEEGTLPDLFRCLRQQLLMPDEVIVVDNASTDRTAAVAKAHGARVVHEPEAGTGNARNAGARAARALPGDVLIFMDSDNQPGPHHLKLGMEPFEKKAVGMVTGPADFNDRWLLAGQRALAAGFRILGYLTHSAAAVGANMLVRADVFEQVGGFDPRAKCALEEVRFATAVVRKAKREVWYLPDLRMQTSDRRLRLEGVQSQAVIFTLGTIAIMLGMRPCLRFRRHSW